MSGKINGYLYSFIVSFVLLFVASSCLPDNEVESNSRVRVFLTLENINSVVSVGDDTLGVTVLKFIHGDSYFLNEGDTLYFKESSVIIVHQIQENNMKVLADGVIREGSLERMAFVIEQAPSSVQSVDPDFIAGDTLYSMIIRGTYNDSAFTFKSTQNFISTFELSAPLEAASNSLFEIMLTTDVSNWFVSEEGTILSPHDSAGVSAINNNIEGSFQLESVEQF